MSDALVLFFLGVYLICLFGIGMISSRKISSDQQLFLGNRDLPWWAIGLSVVSTYVGALSFVGAPAWSYTDGLNVLLIHLNYPLAIIFVITVFLPFFYNSGVPSIYDYLERRFGLTSRTLMAAVFLFSNFAYSGVMLYTTALIIGYLTGLDITSTIIGVGILVFFYTSSGGIAAVVWTDVLQTAAFVVGGILVFVLTWSQIPDGLINRLEILDRMEMLQILDYSTDPTEVSTIWTGLGAMSIYHIVVYGVNQMMVQRTLAAKTIGDAKKAYLLMGYVASTIYFLFFAIGVMLFAFYEGKVFEDNNLILIEFVKTSSLPLVTALVAVAIVASAMSSLDSSLNSMATVTMVDFVKRFQKRDSSPEFYLRLTRFFTCFWTLSAVVPAILLIDSDGSVLELLSKFGSFFVGAKLSLYLLGFYSQHASEKGALIGVAAGFFILFLAEIYSDIAWPWYAVIGGGVSIVTGWFASIVLDGYKEEPHEYSINGQKHLFAVQGRKAQEEGWYVLPGSLDRQSLWLFLFFCLNLLITFLFDFIYQY